MLPAKLPAMHPERKVARKLLGRLLTKRRCGNCCLSLYPRRSLVLPSNKITMTGIVKQQAWRSAK
ncbi:MAG: hypothetical protein SXA11_11160 [Cyanobacteriota bacterium]|nr:hypothetical protein [Cyanobacteriota bacterium]